MAPKTNRILRLYISTISPSENLVRPLSLILNLYAPSWFKIKSNPTAVDGAKHCFYVLNPVSQLPKEDQNICEPVLKRNAYFAQHESNFVSRC